MLYPKIRTQVRKPAFTSSVQYFSGATSKFNKTTTTTKNEASESERKT
jgi:hypothetical protein